MDIPNIISKGESENVEFKENFDRKSIETAVAFANTKGGIIFIGINDNGDIKGVTVGKESIVEWTNMIAQSTEPKIIPDIAVMEEYGIVIITIQEYPLKPVSVKGRCYKRVGKSNRVLTPQEIAEMHHRSTGESWDLYPARNVTLDDIDWDTVKKYISKANASGRKNINEFEDSIEILNKLELLKEGVPSWAAVLLFGNGSRKFLHQATIHCGRFKGETTVIDDRMIEGPLIEQIDEAMNFIRKNLNVELVMTGKPVREDKWDYPLEAIREAVVNAVCHRDYTSTSDIQIKIYDNKLIIWNPGNLPFPLTIEDLYRPHPSKPRNKGIARVFYDMGLVEQWGSGIEKMREACVEAKLPEPIFEELHGFQVTFRKTYSEEYLKGMGLNDRQIHAILYLNEYGQIDISAFKGLAHGVTEKTLYRDLQELVERDIIIPHGEKKGRIYKLK